MFPARCIRPFALSLLILALCLAESSVHAQNDNRFKPTPNGAKYARDRQYDLQNVRLNLRVSWEWKTLSGTVTETLAPLREDLKTIDFDAGSHLVIMACTVNDTTAKFEHKDGKLYVTPPSPVKMGVPANVAITYAIQNPPHPPNSIGGFLPGLTWIEPNPFEPYRRPSLWTQGEPEDNHEWVPIYDYPNDKTTSETIIEVPESWYMVGNGRLEGITENPGGQTHTFHWKMTQPFSTYLLSLAGGEMEIATDKWEDVDLIYAVPKGMGDLIPTSFGDTKEMLTFYSQRYGVKYAWPKYAQTCVWDFGGGMENVSATTLIAGALADGRSGVWPMSGLNSHELGHQWFGDLITCADWGNIWLNESFATFLQMTYFEHAYGKDAYDLNRRGDFYSYLDESHRYKRPISTRYYPSPGAMFDRHTYPKGGVVLHALRKLMGDEAFFNGLGHYLQKYGYTPVDTSDLIHALTESSGQNVEPFFAQWIFKPGHPVIHSEWQWDAAKKQVLLHLSQRQDTTDGTPVYVIDLPVGLFAGGKWNRQRIHLDSRKQDFALSCDTEPAIFLLDPDHDYPIEQSGGWHRGEAIAQLTAAPCCIDRLYAAEEISKSPAGALRVLEAAKNETFREVIAEMIRDAARRKSPASRSLLHGFLVHKEGDVRAAALYGLGLLPKNAEDTATIRGFINAREPYSVVHAALEALVTLDAEGNFDAIKAAMTMPSLFDTIAESAVYDLHTSHSAKVTAFLFETAKPGLQRRVRIAALNALWDSGQERPRLLAFLATLQNDEDPQIQRHAEEMRARSTNSQP